MQVVSDVGVRTAAHVRDVELASKTLVVVIRRYLVVVRGETECGQLLFIGFPETFDTSLKRHIVAPST